MNKSKITKILFVFILLFCFVKSNTFADYDLGLGVNLKELDEGLPGTDNAFWDYSKNIPGFNALSSLKDTINFGNFYFKANNDSESGEFNFISVISNFLNIVYGDGSSRDDDFPTRLALQQAFHSNNYCSDQQLYVEESDLMTKQAPGSTGNNYGIFPVYPTLPKVTNNFCDIDYVVSNNFKKVNNFRASDTKCSYNYSIEDRTCMISGNLPLILEYYTNVVVRSLVIPASGCDKSKENKEDSDVNKVKEKASIISKIIGTTVDIATFFTNVMLTPLTTDPINLYAKYVIQDSANFVTSDLIKIIRLLATEGTNPVTEAHAYACVAEIITFRFSDVATMSATMNIWNEVRYNEAKKVIKTHRFCGHNWETWSNDYDYDNSSNNKIIPELGMNNNSMYKAVYECITNSVCDFENFLDEDYCREYSNEVSADRFDVSFCNGVNRDSRNVKNKTYREYLYLGKETVVLNKNNNLDVERNKPEDDNRTNRIDYNYYDCIDPRLPQIKGFVQPNQRYYMRGNKKANFQCNRFFYDGQGCVVNGSHINSEDKQRLRKIFKRIVYKNSNMMNYNVYDNSNMNDYGNDEYFIIDPTLNESARNLANEFTNQCSLAFENARKCCKRRSENFICIEEHSENIIGEDKGAKTYFCMGNVLANPNKDTRKTLYDYAVEESISDDDNKVVGTVKTIGKTVYNSAKIMGNAIIGMFTNKADFLKNGSQDEVKIVCNTSTGKFEATKKIDTHYVCVFSKSYCPYNFRLNAGLNYKASFCDSSALVGLYSDFDSGIGRFDRHLSKTYCDYGFFYNENIFGENPKYNTNEDNLNNDEIKKRQYMNRYVSTMVEEYDEYAKERGYNNSVYNILYFHKMAKDMGYEIGSNKDNSHYENGYNRHDFEIIYDDKIYSDTSTVQKLENLSYIDFSKYSNGNIYKIKNFCQYKAHCVEVEIESEDTVASTGLSLFIDNSCLGKSSNSRSATNISILGQKLPKQFSTPIVECIYESFSNIISGVAGSSLCNNGYNLNNDGFCGGDTEELIKKLIDNNQMYELKTRYKEIDGSLIIKGQLMPDSYAPFIKLQKYLLNTMKALLTLFLALYGLSKIITGDLKSILDFITSPKLSQQVLNFAIVMWLAFGNGMYKSVYQKIKDFSLGTFLFMDEIIVGSMMEKTSSVLKPSETVRAMKVLQTFQIDGSTTEFPLCYHKNFNGDIIFLAGRINTLIGDENNNVLCPLGYRQLFNKTMYIYTGKQKMDNLKNELVISNNQAINSLLYFIDTYNSKNYNKIYLVVNSSRDANDYVRDMSDIWNPKYDGCYFSTYEYKEGKEYLSLFDTMDCKMSKYFGFMLDRGLPNIFIFSAIMMIPELMQGIPFVGTLASLFSKLFNFAGTALFTLMITYFLSFVNLVIRMIFIFTTSFLNLGVLLMFTPAMLPLILFEKTKSMFDSWFKQIRGAIITPCMNVFPIVMIFHILDSFLFNDITFIKFTNFGRQPNIVCPNGSINIICFISNGIPVFKQLSFILNNFSLLWKIVLNMLLSLLIIKLGEKMLDELKNIITNLIPWGDKSSSLSNYDGRDITDFANPDKVFETAGDWGEGAVSGAKNVLNKSKNLVERTAVKGVKSMMKLSDEIKDSKWEKDKSFGSFRDKMGKFNDINLTEEFDDYIKNNKKDPYTEVDDIVGKIFNPGRAVKEILDEKEVRHPNSSWVKFKRAGEHFDNAIKKVESFLSGDEYDFKARMKDISSRGKVSDYVDSLERYSQLTLEEKEEIKKRIEDLKQEMIYAEDHWYKSKKRRLKELRKKILELDPYAFENYENDVYGKMSEKKEAYKQKVEEFEKNKESKKKKAEERMKKIAEDEKKKKKAGGGDKKKK